MWKSICALAKSILIWLLRLILARLEGPVADPLTLSITSDVGAVANFLTECAKAGLDLVELFNSPQVVQGRLNVANQAARDKIAADADAGLNPGADLTKVEEDLS